MPVKPIYGSYPYLTISKLFCVEYSDVLEIANFQKEARRKLGVGPHTQAAYDRIEQQLEPRDQMVLFIARMRKAEKNFNDIVNEGWDQS